MKSYIEIYQQGNLIKRTLGAAGNYLRKKATQKIRQGAQDAWNGVKTGAELLFKASPFGLTSCSSPYCTYDAFDDDNPFKGKNQGSSKTYYYNDDFGDLGGKAKVTLIDSWSIIGDGKSKYPTDSVGLYVIPETGKDWYQIHVHPSLVKKFNIPYFEKGTASTSQFVLSKPIEINALNVEQSKYRNK